MSSVTRVRDLLFGTNATRWTGRGSRVLLIDSGIDLRHDMGGRLQHLPPEDESSPPAAHAFRGASLCAEGEEARGLAGAPLGVAPQAQLVSARSEDLARPAGLEHVVRSIVERFGRPDVTAHPYSAVESHALAHEGRDEYVRVGEEDESLLSVHVAAAGHDPGRVRFPASCPSVIAVGVCNERGEPASYCGTDPQARKPELLVPDHGYVARNESGQLDVLRGTSAAVNIVAGLAALWCERIRAERVEPSPWLVRAALLASSEPSASVHHRIASVHAALREPGLLACLVAGEPDTSPWSWRVRASASGKLRFCAVVRHRSEGARWLARPCPVAVRTVGSTESAASGDGWVVHEIEAERGEIIDVRVTASGPIGGVGLVVLGPARVEDESRPAPKLPRRPRVVVGISASHDASACVIRDGRLECAIQLERLTRKKHDGHGFLHSREAVDYCLDTLGLRAREVDAFAFNLQPVLPGYVGLSQPTADRAFDLFDPFGQRAVFVSHHLSHAFATFFASPFREAAVFVADGSGGSTVGADDLLLRGPAFAEYLARPWSERPMLHVQSTYRFGRAGYELVDRERAPSFNVRAGSSSLGEVYASVSQYIFGDWQEGGKLMGLAPYGSPDELGPSLLVADGNGRLQFRDEWKDAHRRALGTRKPYEERHLAARIQRDLETALIDRAKRVVALTGMRTVAYTGGIALNSAANEKMKREAELDALYILPASNDAGIAIGAAAAAEFLLTGGTERAPVESDFLGYPYGDADCRRAIEKFGSVIAHQRLDLSDVVERLAAGQVIGWFEGASEFGPRALGHRSVLADASSKRMWEHINRQIKFREDFRPFAPAVPEEEAGKYFDMTGASPYMLRVVPVRPEVRARLGAVTHVDGSARVQTVNRTVLPRFHELLRRYGARTGIPILLNTSLNVRGEPVVETPVQAIEMLLATHLDGMVLGDHFVTPVAAPRSISLSARPSLPPKTHVACRSHADGPEAVLVGQARGGEEVVLDRWLFDVLADADGEQPLAQLLDEHLPADVSRAAALEQISALARLRLVLFSADDAVGPGQRTQAASADSNARPG